jgi:hypothetical protein
MVGNIRHSRVAAATVMESGMGNDMAIAGNYSGSAFSGELSSDDSTAEDPVNQPSRVIEGKV